MFAGALAVPTSNAALLAGDYELPKGRGTLSISRTPDGATRFKIDTVGGNGHSCYAEGVILGVVGHLTPELGMADECTLAFTESKRSVSVSLSSDTCPALCGARASIDGVYQMPSSMCRASTRERAQTQAKTQFNSASYLEAQATLLSLYRNCMQYLNWIEIDEVRNQLAKSQQRVGRERQCRKTLRETLAAKYSNEDSLRGELAPTDFDNYIPTAQAIWETSASCNKEGSPAKAK
jgi:hypothetical protein